MRAVLWDFDETLAFRPGRWAGCLVEVLDEHEPGHGFTADSFRPALRNGFPWHQPDVPHPELVDAELWWAPVEALIGGAYAGAGYTDGRARELAGLARRHFVDPTQGWTLFDDTIPALERLRDEGWRHVILSNHAPELAVIAEHLGLGELVDAVVNSAVTGYEKPHPEAFAAARRAAKADELWMVGDNPVADIEGAEAAGIPSILVRRPPGNVTLAEAAARISQSVVPGRFND